jgi:opacity protein-like surface antigen
MGKMVKFLLCVFAAVWVCVSAAKADVMPPQRQEFSGFSGGYHNLTFDKFDDADGTLTSIKIIFSLTITGGTLILDNDGDDAVSGTLEFGYDACITSTDVVLPSIINNVFYSEVFNLTDDDGDGAENYDPTPPDGLQYDGENENGRVLGCFDSDFSGYRGDGDYNITINLNLATRTICNGSAGLGLIYEIIEYPNPAGYVTVFYNYTPVPEPATVALLCFGGAFVILGSKKKK